MENWKLIHEFFARPASGIKNFLLWVPSLRIKLLHKPMPMVHRVMTNLFKRLETCVGIRAHVSVNQINCLNPI